MYPARRRRVRTQHHIAGFAVAIDEYDRQLDRQLTRYDRPGDDELDRHSKRQPSHRMMAMSDTGGCRLHPLRVLYFAAAATAGTFPRESTTRLAIRFSITAPLRRLLM